MAFSYGRGHFESDCACAAVKTFLFGALSVAMVPFKMADSQEDEDDPNPVGKKPFMSISQRDGAF